VLPHGAAIPSVRVRFTDFLCGGGDGRESLFSSLNKPRIINRKCKQLTKLLNIINHAMFSLRRAITIKSFKSICLTK